MELQYFILLRVEGSKVIGYAEKIYENSSKDGVSHIIHYIGRFRSRADVEGHLQKRYLGPDILSFHFKEENENRKSTTFYQIKISKRCCAPLKFYEGFFESTIANQTGFFNFKINERFEQLPATKELLKSSEKQIQQLVIDAIGETI